MSGLVDFIVAKTDEWRSHRNDNYEKKWEEYERLWRGVWADEDKTRESERSKIISPALQQAIENHTSEIEEALFGQGGKLFDIEDDMQDTDPRDVDLMKHYMQECFRKNKLRKAVGDVILLGSIYGTGIGELVLTKVTELHPATQPIPDAAAIAVGVVEKDKVQVKLKPVSPRNFLIDPNASCIEDAMGCAIEEFVSSHSIAQKIKEGVYRDVSVKSEATPDDAIEPSSIEDHHDKDKINVIRYYGLVPLALLEATDGEDEIVDLFSEGDKDLMEEYGDMVEAIVVIGNGEMLLKAERSPYMMKDRPVVAYQDDSVPNRFWGRGVAEKGFNMQKAIDAQIRTHLDSLALTSVPMVAMDATRLPRGSKFEIRPGKSVLTNGNPNEILMPFKFGQIDPSNIETAGKFETMLLQATGTVDNASMVAAQDGGVMSPGLASLIKRNKRTLVNFQEQFLIPFVEKAAWRFMQYDPENFPVQDFKFIPVASMGMLAREVEQVQFINLMKTLGPDSPLLPILMKGVVGNSSLSNKQELVTLLDQSMQPNPQAEQEAQQLKQAQIAEFGLNMEQKKAEIEKTQAETAKLMTQIQLLPQETQARIMSALTNNLPDEDERTEAEFQRRVKLADLMLRERDLDQNWAIVNKQMEQSSKE